MEAKPRTLPASRFIGVDGEGIHDRYVLFAAGEQALFKRNGIALEDALEWLLERWVKGCTYVAFAFHYDVCKMVENYQDDWILSFMRGEETTLGDWSLQYLPKHMLRAHRRGKPALVIYDVVQFFNRSFENTMEFMSLRDETGLISWGKSMRAQFKFHDLERIRAYNALECRLLAQMCAKLDESMRHVDLFIESWHGPGALAAQALKKARAAAEVVRFPRPEWSRVLNHAYFGGRIEAPKLGSFKGVTNYDIRSAYPEACTYLWNQKEGQWLPIADWDARFPWSVWHLEWQLPRSTYLGPLPWRTQSGRIYYPLTGRGWYWWPEASLAKRLHPEVRVLEGWVFDGNTKSTLATTVAELYHKRLALKVESKNLEAYVLKIVLNSLYGKMAQSVGHAPFFTRAWAGYVTSSTRAKLREAVYGAEERVIALATDGIVLAGEGKLPLTEGTGLGQWERTIWDSGVVLGSGIYRLDAAGQTPKLGSRGGRMDFDDAIRQLDLQNFIRNEFTGFVTPTLAILMPEHFGPYRGKFMKQTRIIAPWTDLQSKRIYHWTDTKWSQEFCDSFPQLGVLEESAPYPEPEDLDARTLYFERRRDQLQIADSD